jgi:hypothetical protein
MGTFICKIALSKVSIVRNRFHTCNRCKICGCPSEIILKLVFYTRLQKLATLFHNLTYLSLLYNHIVCWYNPNRLCGVYVSSTKNIIAVVVNQLYVNICVVSLLIVSKVFCTISIQFLLAVVLFLLLILFLSTNKINSLDRKPREGRFYFGQPTKK